MDMFSLFEGIIPPAVKPHQHNADCGCEPVPTKRKQARSRLERLEARFNAKVDKSAGPNACWLWTGKPDVGSGYGRIQHNGIKTQAHRVAYMLAKGPIPAGKNVLHARGCKSKLCCNPAHLRSGSALENAADAKAEKRLRKKLTPTEVCEIVVSVRDLKLKYDAAGKKHGVRPQTVFNIMTGKTWAKLTGFGRTRSIPLNRRGKVELRAVA